MKKIINLLIISCLLIGCEAAEDLFKGKDPPQVSQIHSNVGFRVNPNQTVKYWITASDPEGGTLSYRWIINGGTILSGTQSDTLIWQAPTIGGGNYLLKIEVSNESESTSREENITVLSFSAPIVNILSPINNEFVVQNSSIQVESEIIPNVQISEVQFYVNDSLINSKLAQSSAIYTFPWNVVQNPGIAEIKIKAIQITSVFGLDSINVNIEGILPGKGND